MLAVSPDPVVFGDNVTVTAHADVTADAATPLSAQVVISRKVGPEWAKVPCMTVQGIQVGSCDYADVCSMIPPGVPVPCPVPAGAYDLPKTTFALPVPPGVPKSLLEGTYKLEVSVTDDGSKPYACFQAQFATTGAATKLPVAPKM